MKENKFIQYFNYLIIYSILGFLLERLINIIFLGYYYDNSFLFGPWQPLYGSGVLIGIILIEKFKLLISPMKWYKISIATLLSIVTTYLVEAITGYGFEYFFEMKLWDYRDTFGDKFGTQYVNLIASTLFGTLSFLVILFIHPFIKIGLNFLHINIRYIVCILFIIDIVYTFINKI